MVHCAGCERPILDRFLLNVLDRAWHAKCVQCCECKCNLTEKCFSREGRLYCKNDFFRYVPGAFLHRHTHAHTHGLWKHARARSRYRNFNKLLNCHQCKSRDLTVPSFKTLVMICESWCIKDTHQRVPRQIHGIVHCLQATAARRAAGRRIMPARLDRSVSRLGSILACRPACLPKLEWKRDKWIWIINRLAEEASRQSNHEHTVSTHLRTLNK